MLEFDRRPLDRDPLRGFALDWTEDLTLLQVMEDQQFRLNGYTVFRNADVKQWRTVGPDEFSAKAAKLHRLRPMAPAGLRYSSMQEAALTAGAAFPLITIHQERLDRNVCFVGKVERVTRRRVTILPISPAGNWETKREHYEIADITRIDFGGAYETLLARMGG
ncbi:MAG: hypothetical protein JNK87_12950 [Bryobacterales bacterium]|nr:hypothetical protein [Bryobacterales bacterium]